MGQPLQRVDSDLERQVTTWFCHSLAVTWQLTVIIVCWSSFKKRFMTVYTVGLFLEALWSKSIHLMK